MVDRIVSLAMAQNTLVDLVVENDEHLEYRMQPDDA